MNKDNQFQYDERMDPKYPTNFSYWRAKILTVLVEWAKSFEVCFEKKTRIDVSN